MAKVLFVVTGASYWTLKDGTRHPTGYWAEEFAAPYSALSGAGHEVALATPGGGGGPRRRDEPAAIDGWQ
jgi:putative intracellular protease/amidase